jgi:hypothetical protein
VFKSKEENKMVERPMKVTKSQLKQIIKEEISTLTEGGEWPGSRTSLQAVASLADAISNDLGIDLYEENIGERLTEIILKEFYEGEEAPLRIGTPKEDPWALKKRLGIGGSVHDRLGGPRHREDK